MLFTLASLLDETKKLLFRPSLECIMESMLWYRIYPSQAHQWCFKWHPPVFKGLYHACIIKILFVYLPPAILSLSSLLFLLLIFSP